MTKANDRNLPRGERIKLLNRFCDESAKQLSAYEFAVWVTLWRHGFGNTVEIGYTRLSDVCGFGRTTIRRIVPKLIAKGLLVRLRAGSENKSVSRYQLFPDVKTGRQAEYELWKRAKKCKK